MNPILFNILMTIAIFFAKLIEISLSSIRLIFVVKQERFKAAIIAFIECLIWAFVVSGIIDGLTENMLWLVSYCLGFASGVYAGTVIENKLAIGNRSIQFIASIKDKDNILNKLSELGHGYTILNASGSKEEKVIILTIVKRKDLQKIITDIEKLCVDPVFSVTSDVSNVIGGIGLKK